MINQDSETRVVVWGSRTRGRVADQRQSTVGHDPAVSLRLLYVIFWQVLGRVLLMGRAAAPRLPRRTDSVAGANSCCPEGRASQLEQRIPSVEAGSGTSTLLGIHTTSTAAVQNSPTPS
jgi:hypothetical protein